MDRQDRTRPPNYTTSPFYNVSLFVSPDMLQYPRIRSTQDILFGSSSEHLQQQQQQHQSQSQHLPQQHNPHQPPQHSQSQPHQSHSHQHHLQHSQSQPQHSSSQPHQSHQPPQHSLSQQLLPHPQLHTTHLFRHHQSAPLPPIQQPSIPRPNIKTILSGGIKEYVEKNGVTNPFFSAKRVMNDLAELEEKPLVGVYVGPANDHILSLMAVIEGPADTVYEGGTFFVDVTIPQKYPFEPPELKFRTQIYHPNINSHGAVCLSAISKEWRPDMTLFNVFEALMSLLYIYDLEEPLVQSIAKIYKDNPKEFEKNAKLWTQRYSICTFEE